MLVTRCVRPLATWRRRAERRGSACSRSRSTAVRQLAEPLGASADDVYSLTGGNPFYVTEALAAPPGSLSTSVRLAVLARASRLSAPARAVLDAVAIVPGRAEAWLLDGLVHPAVEDVDECLAAGVLLTEDGALVFRHELACRAIEHEIPAGRAGELHRHAVATLMARPNLDPARLAHHARTRRRRGHAGPSIVGGLPSGRRQKRQPGGDRPR